MRPVAVSIAGVVHTAAPSLPAGTVKVCQRIAPVASSSATRLPRARESSLFGPDVPTYTAPFQKTGLPYTLESGCVVSRASQRLAPSFRERASRRGPPRSATGTKAVGPAGASRSIAALPLIGAPASFDQSSFPV